MEIEKLFVSLALDAAKYAEGLKDSQNEGKSWAQRMRQTIGGGLQKAAQVGIAALLGVGLAIGGVAANGINQFIGFQNQMNEVFTLMPGITQDAMDDMSDRVLQFSRDFAVLPEEVVPALYQSLSAGVPPDNVFSFLETAQMAAVGGITDLETAVDGITSVVNAYGDEVIDAATASDVMFTAVRLGKTDFSQLSASLFNVIPTAASLGISFEEVAAGLATLTAQGTPTSVATTQLRQLFVEASKSGSQLDNTIRELTGVGITDLIAEGGNVADVLQQVRDSVGDEEFRNLFGSVEALNAALGITGPNAELMADNMDAMTDSAGATQAAYDQMNSGITRSIERFRAFASTALIQVGDALSPVIDKVLGLAEEALPFVETALSDVTGFLEGFFTNLENGQDILTAAVDAFLTWTNIGENLPDEAFQFVLDLETAVRTLWAQLLVLWQNIQPVIDIVIAAITEFVSWKDVLIALGLLIGGVILNIIISLVAALAPIVIAVAAIIGIVALLRNAWENDWGGIRTSLIEFWENTARPALEQLWQWLSVNVPVALEALRTFWVDTAWPAIQAALQVAWGVIQFIFDLYVQYITGIVIPAIQALWDYWVNTAWPAIQTAIETVWPIIEEIFNAISEFIINTVIPAVQEFYTKWTEEWWPEIQTAIENTWTIISEIFTELGRWINDNVIPWVEFLWDKWVNVWWPEIQQAIENAWAAIQPALAAIEEAASPVKDAIEAILEAAERFWNWLTSHSFEFNISIPDLPDWAIPGSPLPIHTAWKNFAQEMNRTTIAPQVNVAGVASLAGAAFDAGGSSDNRRYDTTVQLMPGQDPLRALRASRHLDKLGSRRR